MKEKKEKKEKSLIDENGNSIPVKFLDALVVERHKLVEEIIDKVLKEEERLKAFKQQCFKKIEAYLAKTAGRYGESWQGNASLYNFSKTKQVAFKIHKVLTFDERLNVAKRKIDEYLKSKTENADDDLKMLVLKAFDVDKKGNVDFKQIFSLKQYKINNPLWQEAMSIIDDAVSVVGSKEYMTFSVRPNPKNDWDSVILNFSALKVDL